MYAWHFFEIIYSDPKYPEKKNVASKMFWIASLAKVNLLIILPARFAPINFYNLLASNFTTIIYT